MATTVYRAGMGESLYQVFTAICPTGSDGKFLQWVHRLNIFLIEWARVGTMYLLLSVPSCPSDNHFLCIFSWCPYRNRNSSTLYLMHMVIQLKF